MMGVRNVWKDIRPSVRYELIFFQICLSEEKDVIVLSDDKEDYDIRITIIVFVCNEPIQKNLVAVN